MERRGQTGSQGGVARAYYYAGWVCGLVGICGGAGSIRPMLFAFAPGGIFVLVATTYVYRAYPRLNDAIPQLGVGLPMARWQVALGFPVGAGWIVMGVLSQLTSN